jgi:3-oxoacyl-[acyl-carrier protein] reductase
MLISHKGVVVNPEFADRVVIVTGAARGIGKRIAESFADEGARVVVFDRETLGDLDARLTVIRCDISSRTEVDASVARVEAEFGRVDILVNNAGINVEGSIESLTDDAWERCFDVNVTGTFRMCRAVIPGMKSRRFGRIVNAASFAAIVPSVGAAAYGASKAAVVHFTRVLAGEVGPWGITANSYAPGMVPTAMNGFADLPPEAQSRLLDTLTLRRWEEPDDVAAAVKFLASDAASYITGTLLDVSGGKLATQMPSRAYENSGI